MVNVSIKDVLGAIVNTYMHTMNTSSNIMWNNSNTSDYNIIAPTEELVTGEA